MIKHLPPLKPQENEELLRRAVETGDPALREEFAARNMRLISYIAHKYGNVLPFDEAFSMCQIGFTKALNTFNLDKKVKFATYATLCMQNEMRMVLRRDQRHAPSGMSIDYVITSDEGGNDLKLEDVLAAPDTDPDQDLMLSEDRQLLKEVLAEFKEKHSERDFGILMMSIVEQATQKEIGQRYGISQSYASRMREKLMKELHHTTERVQLRKALAESAAAEEYKNQQKEEREEMAKQKREAQSKVWNPEWKGLVIYLKQNYPTLSGKSIGEIIGKSDISVYQCWRAVKEGKITGDPDPTAQLLYEDWRQRKAAQIEEQTIFKQKKENPPEPECGCDSCSEQEESKEEIPETPIWKQVMEEHGRPAPESTWKLEDSIADENVPERVTVQRADGASIELSNASSDDILDAINFIWKRLKHDKNHEFFIGFKEVKA